MAFPDNEPVRRPVKLSPGLRNWAARTARDVALNVAGFLLMVFATGLLAAAIRGTVEWLLQRGWAWPALAFVLLAGVAWATLFGLVDREHLRNPEGRILPLPAMGFVVGSALLWVYIFAGLSYGLARVGAVEYTVARQPEALLAFLTDAYTWHLLDLVPGLKITTTMGWTSPVDLDGGARGALLVMFRAVVIYQVVAKGRQFLNPDPPAGPAAGFKVA
jgi:hypothetical protein